MGLRTVERLPLALRLHRSSLLQLSQTPALLLDHLVAWGRGGERVEGENR